jgi:endonuclease I
MFSISGFDSNTPGENLVTVTYGDFSTTFTVTILENTNSLVLSEYYKNAEGLTGNALLLALRTIINTGKVNISYDDARYILDETDRDPDNPDNVILIYTRASVPGEWNYPTWNREHVWPQSLLGNDSVMTSDLQNLKPSDVDENGFRGNKYFDNVSSTVAYEPPDEVKGDIARILFYMVVMYDKLALVNQAPTTYQMAMFSVLLSWHEADPVDDFERNRNDVIFQYQKNRNPFIDYPEFVELIWG